jgi:hypothetical protein
MRKLPSQELDTITAGELKVAARIGLDTWTLIEANASPVLDDDDLLTLDDLLTVTGAEELTVHPATATTAGSPFTSTRPCIVTAGGSVPAATTPAQPSAAVRPPARHSTTSSAGLPAVTMPPCHP